VNSWGTQVAQVTLENGESKQAESQNKLTQPMAERRDIPTDSKITNMYNQLYNQMFLL